MISDNCRYKILYYILISSCITLLVFYDTSSVYIIIYIYQIYSNIMIESYDNAWFRNHFDDISVSLHCYICSPEKLISPVWFVYYAVCDSFCNQATSPHLDHLAGNKHLNCWSRNGDKGTPQCKLSKNMEVKKEKKTDLSTSAGQFSTLFMLAIQSDTSWGW